MRLPSLSEHGRVEGYAALDAGERPRELCRFAGIERGPIGVGEVLRDFGGNLGAPRRFDAALGQPRVEFSMPLTPRLGSG